MEKPIEIIELEKDKASCEMYDNHLLYKEFDGKKHTFSTMYYGDCHIAVKVQKKDTVYCCFYPLEINTRTMENADKICASMKEILKNNNR